MNWHLIWNRAIASLLAIMFSLSVVVPVFANAPAPPRRYWLYFDRSVDLQGIQVGQCRDKNCRQAVLLGQSGKCDRPGCLNVTAKSFSSDPPFTLELANHLALISLLPTRIDNEFDPTKTQIRAQIGDRVVASKIFPLTEGNDNTDRYKVNVIANNLELSPDPKLSETSESSVVETLILPSFQTSFFLTMAIESAIWAAYLYWRKRSPEIGVTIGSLVLAELFSLPIIWVGVPGLQHFSSRGTRNAGLVWLVLAIGYALIIFLYSRRKQPMRATEVGSIAYWLGAVVATFIVYFLSSYGSPTPSAIGLPQYLALLIGELFVIGYEAVIIHRIGRDRLNFKTALKVSAIANIASCLVGLLVARLPIF